MTRPAPEIPGVPTYLWVVDPHMDRIRRKRFQVAMARQFGSMRPMYPMRFPKWSGAVQALLKRAEDRVAVAEQEAERERGRLKKLRKKYGANAK